MLHRFGWWLIMVGLVISGNREIALAANRSAPNDRVWPKLLRGALDLFAGRYDAAIAKADDILRSDANNADAFALRGYAHLHQRGDARKAVADFSEALRREPGYVVILVARANAYRKIFDYDGAIADCVAAIRGDPTYSEAYASRAGSYLSKQVLGKAIFGLHDCTPFLSPPLLGALPSR